MQKLLLIDTIFGTRAYINAAKIEGITISYELNETKCTKILMDSGSCVHTYISKHKIAMATENNIINLSEADIND